VLEYPLHQGVRQLVKDLNRLYRETPALHRYDFDWRGFEWIDCHDADNSVLSFIRRADEEQLVIVVNFTPVVRDEYRIGVPENGRYREVFNSDSQFYGGRDIGNGDRELIADGPGWMNRPCSLSLTLPPLAGVILQRV
jgi:1,4-alpha-glucan branching enzyme